jgi:hypothetical protein
MAALVISIVYLSLVLAYNNKKADSLRTSYRAAARIEG